MTRSLIPALLPALPSSVSPSRDLLPVLQFLQRQQGTALPRGPGSASLPTPQPGCARCPARAQGGATRCPRAPERCHCSSEEQERVKSKQLLTALCFVLQKMPEPCPTEPGAGTQPGTEPFLGAGKGGTAGWDAPGWDLLQELGRVTGELLPGLVLSAGASPGGAWLSKWDPKAGGTSWAVLSLISLTVCSAR